MPWGAAAVAAPTPNTANWNQSSDGPNGALRLEPASDTAGLSGRSGILLHGGDPVDEDSASASVRPMGGLKPTHGCIRLSNSDMKQRVDVLSSAQENDVAMRSENISVTLSWTTFRPASATGSDGARPLGAPGGGGRTGWGNRVRKAKGPGSSSH